MYEIFVYLDNEEVCNCLSLVYLKTFLEEAGEGDYWVKFKGDFYTPEDFLKIYGKL